jgi:hypothetical protein
MFELDIDKKHKKHPVILADIMESRHARVRVYCVNLKFRTYKVLHIVSHNAGITTASSEYAHQHKIRWNP